MLSGRGLCRADHSLRDPTVCGVSERDDKASIMRRSWSTKGCFAMGEKFIHISHLGRAGKDCSVSWFLTVPGLQFFCPGLTCLLPSFHSSDRP